MKSFEAQPGMLVTAMIHVAVAGLYLDTIEEGLRHKLWADAELEKIARRLPERNLFHVVTEGIRAERAGVLRHLTAMAERKHDPMYQATMDAFTSGEWTGTGRVRIRAFRLDSRQPGAIRADYPGLSGWNKYGTKDHRSGTDRSTECRGRRDHFKMVAAEGDFVMCDAELFEGCGNHG